MAKIKYGISNVHYAVKSTDASGVTTYATPAPIPGAVTLTLDQSGDESKFYADNIAYYTSFTNDGYTGNLEVALLPTKFRQDVLGEIMDATSKVMYENADVEPKEFALLFQIETDDGQAFYKTFFNCKCGRAGAGSTTKTNATTPQTESVSLTASPLENGIVRATSTEETPSATLDTWYDAVDYPTVTP